MPHDFDTQFLAFLGSLSNIFPSYFAMYSSRSPPSTFLRKCTRGKEV